MDLHEQRTVFVRDGRSFARKNGLAFIETSALDATGVDTAFQRILQEIYKTQTKKQLKSQGGGGGKDGGAGGGGGATPAKGQTISLSAPQDQGGDGAPARKQGCCAGGQ
jgi:Ras-related protein Rab-11A